MIHTLVIFQVMAGRAAEFEAGHRELIALMGDQPGCVAIRAHRSLNNPLEYMVYGSWKDKEAWERAMEWGKAHPDYTWGLLKQLRKLESK